MHRRALAACAVAWAAALAGCSPIMHIVLQNDTERVIRVSAAGSSVVVAVPRGGIVDVAPGRGRRFSVQAGDERWTYDRSWLSRDFSSFNRGDSRYVRSDGFLRASRVFAVVRSDGRIFVRFIDESRVPRGLADPQPRGYPLAPLRSL